MSQFEYVAVLVAVIAGLGVVHLLSGVAGLFVAGSRHRAYWIHLLWTWNVFHFIVYFWWFVWRWSAVEEWRLVLYFFVLLYAICLYLLCAILFPTGIDEAADFRSIYYENRRPFFLLWAFTVLVDVIDTRLKMQMGLGGFGVTIVVIWAVLIAGSLVAARVGSPRYHAAWGVAFFGIMAYFELANFSVLRAD
ncbi:MAG: hypothetical protein PVH96_15530 [Gemmatimonadota bacterium]|jgi:hypothetical protein